MALWKKILLVLLGMIVLSILALRFYMQGLGDLRTHYAKTKGSSLSAQQKGRALLEQSIEKIGGVANWKKLREQTVKITFRHDWHSFLLKTFFMPLEFSGQKLSLLLRPGYTSAHLTFLTGRWKNKMWGIHKQRTYQKSASGKLSLEQDKTIQFNVPSYRFFFFMHFYLSEAKLVTYAGTKSLHGNTYDLIYVTWGKWAPQQKVDQYLIWINRKSKMADFVQSTVRDMFARSIVTCSLGNYQAVLGVKLPFSFKVLQDINVVDKGMHHMELLKVEQMKSGALKPPKM